MVIKTFQSQSDTQGKIHVNEFDKGSLITILATDSEQNNRPIQSKE